MTQGERVRAVRKVLDLTMDKFGERLGVSKMAISNIESGNRNLTEQMAKAICREFNVNYAWLTDELGEMFMEPDMEIMGMIDRIMTGENEFHKNCFRLLAKFTEEDLAAVERIIDYWNEITGDTKKEGDSV